MNISIRKSTKKDLGRYTTMLQQTYVDAYVDVSVGLTPECFSIEILQNEDTQQYFKSNLQNDSTQSCWVALDGKELIGAVTVKSEGNSCEMCGFYIHPAYQGRGIGSLLWAKALDYSNGRDITLDIYTHNTKTIELYKHWGFYEDTSRPRFFRHWPEWPEHVQAEELYMRRDGTNLN